MAKKRQGTLIDRPHFRQNPMRTEQYADDPQEKKAECVKDTRRKRQKKTCKLVCRINFHQPNSRRFPRRTGDSSL